MLAITVQNAGQRGRAVLAVLAMAAIPNSSTGTVNACYAAAAARLA